MRSGLAYSFPEAAEPFAVLFIRDTARGRLKVRVKSSLQHIEG